MLQALDKFHHRFLSSNKSTVEYLARAAHKALAFSDTLTASHDEWFSRGLLLTHRTTPQFPA